MSRPPTYARKVDGSHRKVVEAFEFAGASVAVIQSSKAGLPDLVIGVSGSTHLIEVKNPTKLKAHALKPAQVDFAAKWRGSPVHLVRSPQDAWELVALLRMTAATRAKAAALLADRNARQIAGTVPPGDERLCPGTCAWQAPHAGPCLKRKGEVA